VFTWCSWYSVARLDCDLQTGDQIQGRGVTQVQSPVWQVADRSAAGGPSIRFGAVSAFRRERQVQFAGYAKWGDGDWIAGCRPRSLFGLTKPCSQSAGDSPAASVTCKTSWHLGYYSVFTD
jgi:hypothetical protein